jgi:hypothetical protein
LAAAIKCRRSLPSHHHVPTATVQPVMRRALPRRRRLDMHLSGLIARDRTPGLFMPNLFMPSLFTPSLFTPSLFTPSLFTLGSFIAVLVMR